LPKYVEGRRDLWHTIMRDREILRGWVEEMLARLRFLNARYGATRA
jgi:hypothetical protein